jgi:hypothetical protein
MTDSELPGAIEIQMRDGVPTLVITLNIVIRGPEVQMTANQLQSSGEHYTNCPLCSWHGSYQSASNASRAFNTHTRQMHPEIWATPLGTKQIR